MFIVVMHLALQAGNSGLQHQRPKPLGHAASSKGFYSHLLPFLSTLPFQHDFS